MSKRHRGLLSKSDIRKKYHISENTLGQILPPPNEYIFWYGHRIPCWKKKTVTAIMSKPEVQARIEEIKNEHLAKVKAEQLKSQKAKTIKKYLLQFDIAHLIDDAKTMQRRFVIHCGPTNSGKTYASLQALKQAESGCYLGPLRLLALEVFDALNSEDVLCSLLTGEESIEIPFSNITASTIEMCSFQQSYQVAVIDEAQLIADRVRGGHWLNAILRLRAEEIHICVAPEGFQLIESLIAQTLSPYEIIYHDRLVPLNYAGTIPPNDFTNTQLGDAYIAFPEKRS